MSPPVVKSNYKGIELLTTAVVLCDKNYIILFINPSAEVLFEISQNQAITKNVNIFIDNVEFLKKILNQAEQQHGSYREHEYFIKTQHSKTMCVTLTITPFINDQSDFVIEFMQIDQQLKVAKEENMFIQQQANSELLKNLAHEIRNPLGGLRGAAQLLEKELSNKSLKEYTQIIIKEADRLQVLMNKLLTPQQLPTYKATNIHEVLERVRSLILSEFTSDLTLIRDYDVSLPEFIADPEKLIQAVLNIARNGVQAMKNNPQKHMELRFVTRAERQIVFHKRKHEVAIRLDIIDNGPGIKHDMIDKIFYPLVSGRENGSGLGLSLAQDFISLHEGMIECNSSSEKTVFSIILPLKNNFQENKVTK